MPYHHLFFICDLRIFICKLFRVLKVTIFPCKTVAKQIVIISGSAIISLQQTVLISFMLRRSAVRKSIINNIDNSAGLIVMVLIIGSSSNITSHNFVKIHACPFNLDSPAIVCSVHIAQFTSANGIPVNFNKGIISYTEQQTGSILGAATKNSVLNVNIFQLDSSCYRIHQPTKKSFGGKLRARLRCSSVSYSNTVHRIMNIIVRYHIFPCETKPSAPCIICADAGIIFCYGSTIMNNNIAHGELRAFQIHALIYPRSCNHPLSAV